MLVLEIKGTSGSVSAAVTLSLQLSVPSDLIESTESKSLDSEIEALVEEDAMIGGLEWSFLSSNINTPGFDLQSFQLLLSPEEQDRLNGLMIRHGLLICSDKTKLGGKSWEDLKGEAMQIDYKHADWFVSNSVLSNILIVLE